MINHGKNKIDLGNNHSYIYYSWTPDRKLNPQYKNIPDVHKYGIIIFHLNPQGKECRGSVLFDSETSRMLSPDRDKWQVQSWEPLTLSPSVLCSCGDHGFIKEGRWEAV